MDVREKLPSEKRLIDANALIKEANADGAYGYVDAKQIADAPTVDAVEVVRHGRWICVDTDTEQFFLCNRCKKKEYWESNYCPNCGCRMDGGNE